MREKLQSKRAIFEKMHKEREKIRDISQKRRSLPGMNPVNSFLSWLRLVESKNAVYHPIGEDSRCTNPNYTAKQRDNQTGNCDSTETFPGDADQRRD